jgi:DNA uptake protein ComE-like DNA-binding protein
VQREAEAGFEIFCEWMGFGRAEIDSLKQQLNQVSEIKPFKLKFQPVKKLVRTPSRTSRRTQMTRKTVSVTDQTARQNTDFARLFHSSLVDRELLARPYMEGRKESARKYAGMWASRTVNINTAPRHVLEAAFAFGSPADAPKIAEGIIQRRREEPFTDIDDLKQSLSTYSDSIRRCERYVTTASRFFTIRVTAVSGVAKASAVAAITKEQGKTKLVAVISG